MLMLRKIVFFFFFLFVGLSLFAQQDYMVSSYVRVIFTTVVVSLQKACGQVTTLFS